jgi:50S ribosomal subunit-associated GTPase HflX
MIRKQLRVALYARVSTDGQTVANQRRELEAVAERHGWLIVEVLEDKGERGDTPAAIGSGTQIRLGRLDSQVSAATIAASRALIPMATASQ